MPAEDSPNQEPNEGPESLLSSQESIQIELTGGQVYAILWPEDAYDNDLRNARGRILAAVCDFYDADNDTEE